MDNYIVVKLGGSSQTTIGYNRLIRYAQTIDNFKIVIVLSAVSGVTDLLEKYATTKDEAYLDQVKEKNDKLCSDLELRCDLSDYYNGINVNDDIHNKAKIIGLGERLSTAILFEYMKPIFKDVKLLSSYDFIKSTKEIDKLYDIVEFYGDKEVFLKLCGNSKIMICQGFIASTPSNQPILLGRGGSDTSGSIIANMLDAIEYRVWTDVSGIYECDPKLIKEAKRVDEIDYDLAQEISGMGAKVMHPYSIGPCKIKNIPIIIENTFDDSDAKTVIRKMNHDTYNHVFIAVQKNITLFKITSLDMWNSYGFVTKIFKKFSDNKIDVNVITTSPYSICTTTDETNDQSLRNVTNALHTDFQVEVIRNCCIVSVVASNVKKTSSLIDFNKFESHIIHFGANNMSLNFVVNDHSKNDIVNYLYYQVQSYDTHPSRA